MSPSWSSICGPAGALDPTVVEIESGDSSRIRNLIKRAPQGAVGKGGIMDGFEQPKF